MSEFLFLFVNGYLLGLSVAAPIGPINVLCIQQSLNHGFRAGFAVAVGCAGADASYAAVAAFGLTAISSVLVAQQQGLRLVGAAVLLFLAWRAFSRGPARAGEAETGEGGPAKFARAVVTSYGLTITNPLTIVIFAALFAGVGIAELDADGSAAKAGILVAGVFTGTISWMVLLAGISEFVRARARDGFLAWANRAGGAILLAFAGWLFWQYVGGL
jgi:putative LysE/RhtB family amino acid efflux pump